MRVRISLQVAIFAIAAGLLAGGLLAGCGDDEEPATTAGATGATGDAGPTTKAEFIDEADDVCAEANVAVANLDTGDAGTDASQELSITQGTLDSLESLGDPPAEDEAAYDDFLSAQRDLVEALEKQELAAQRGEDTGAAEAEVDEARADVRQAADDYGFTECGAEGETITTDTAPGEPGGETTAPATTPTAPATTPTTPTTPAPTTPTETAPPAAPPAPPSGGTGAGGGGGGTAGGGTSAGGVSP